MSRSQAADKEHCQTEEPHGFTKNTADITVVHPCRYTISASGTTNSKHRQKPPPPPPPPHQPAPPPMPLPIHVDSYDAHHHQIPCEIRRACDTQLGRGLTPRGSEFRVQFARQGRGPWPSGVPENPDSRGRRGATLSKSSSPLRDGAGSKLQMAWRDMTWRGMYGRSRCARFWLKNSRGKRMALGEYRIE